MDTCTTQENTFQFDVFQVLFEDFTYVDIYMPYEIYKYDGNQLVFSQLLRSILNQNLPEKKGKLWFNIYNPNKVEYKPIEEIRLSPFFLKVLRENIKNAEVEYTFGYNFDKPNEIFILEGTKINSENFFFTDIKGHNHPSDNRKTYLDSNLPRKEGGISYGDLLAMNGFQSTPMILFDDKRIFLYQIQDQVLYKKNSPKLQASLDNFKQTGNWMDQHQGFLLNQFSRDNIFTNFGVKIIEYHPTKKERIDSLKAKGNVYMGLPKILMKLEEKPLFHPIAKRTKNL